MRIGLCGSTQHSLGAKSLGITEGKYLAYKFHVWDEFPFYLSFSKKDQLTHMFQDWRQVTPVIHREGTFSRLFWA